MFTHFVVREDAQLLYGFNDKQERALFRELIKVNGVGPKLALAILSGMSAQRFVSAVEREGSLHWSSCRAWAKTAERPVVEMKDRFKGLNGDLFNSSSGSACRPSPTKRRMWTRKPRPFRRWWRWAISRRKPAAWSARLPSRAPTAKP